jgi:hypothetical protein
VDSSIGFSIDPGSAKPYDEEHAGQSVARKALPHSRDYTGDPRRVASDPGGLGRRRSRSLSALFTARMVDT